MTPDEVARTLAAFGHEISAARRQLAKGQMIDLAMMPARLQAFFNSIEPSATQVPQPQVVSLLAECDQLVREIEMMHGKLGQELRLERRRSTALSAYGRPRKGPG